MDRAKREAHTMTLQNQMWQCWALSHWKPLLEKHGRHFLAARGIGSWPPEAYAGRLGECFANAANLVCLKDSNFSYVEGLAERPSVGIVTEHAWVIDKRTNDIIDPTWKNDGVDYVGVAFETAGVRKHILGPRCKGSMIVSASCASEPETLKHIVVLRAGIPFRFPPLS